MKKIIMALAASVATISLTFSCEGVSADKDMTPPEILPIGDYASPLNCQGFVRGSVMQFAYLFTDNVELGSFNIEVHNNFDYHTHSTEAGECESDHDHDHGHGESPVNPWVFNRDYTIPAGSTSYEARLEIPIPEDVDEGTYHFMIRVTDTSGWQQLRSVGIRILEEGED